MPYVTISPNPHGDALKDARKALKGAEKAWKDSDEYQSEVNPFGPDLDGPYYQAVLSARALVNRLETSKRKRVEIRCLDRKAPDYYVEVG